MVHDPHSAVSSQPAAVGFLTHSSTFTHSQWSVDRAIIHLLKKGLGDPSDPKKGPSRPFARNPSKSNPPQLKIDTAVSARPPTSKAIIAGSGAPWSPRSPTVSFPSPSVMSPRANFPSPPSNSHSPKSHYMTAASSSTSDATDDSGSPVFAKRPDYYDTEINSPEYYSMDLSQETINSPITGYVSSGGDDDLASVSVPLSFSDVASPSRSPSKNQTRKIHRISSHVTFSSSVQQHTVPPRHASDSYPSDPKGLERPSSDPTVLPPPGSPPRPLRSSSGPFVRPSVANAPSQNQEREMKRREQGRASQWRLSSFSNSVFYEGHHRIENLRLIPGELIEVHRRERFVLLPRGRRYVEPYFDSLAYWLRPKGGGGGKRTGDHYSAKEKSSPEIPSRGISVKSSTSSINMRAMIASPTSRRASIRERLGSPSLSTSDHEGDPSLASEAPLADFENHNTTGTVETMGSPPKHIVSSTSALSAQYLLPHQGSSHQLQSYASSSSLRHQLDMIPSNTMDMASKEKGRSKSGVYHGAQWKLRLLVIRDGWLRIWKQNTPLLGASHSEPSVALELKHLVSAKEMAVHHLLPPSSQPGRCIVARFSIRKIEQANSGHAQHLNSRGEITLNMPDEACHSNLLRVLMRIAHSNEMAQGRRTSQTASLQSHDRQSPSLDSFSHPSLEVGRRWLTWRESIIERAEAVGRGDSRHEGRTLYDSLRSSSQSSASSSQMSAGSKEDFQEDSEESANEWDNWENEFGDSFRRFSVLDLDDMDDDGNDEEDYEDDATEDTPSTQFDEFSITPESRSSARARSKSIAATTTPASASISPLSPLEPRTPLVSPISPGFGGISGSGRPRSSTVTLASFGRPQRTRPSTAQDAAAVHTPGTDAAPSLSRSTSKRSEVKKIVYASPWS